MPLASDDRGRLVPLAGEGRRGVELGCGFAAPYAGGGADALALGEPRRGAPCYLKFVCEMSLMFLKVIHRVIRVKKSYI